MTAATVLLELVNSVWVWFLTVALIVIFIFVIIPFHHLVIIGVYKIVLYYPVAGHAGFLQSFMEKVVNVKSCGVTIVCQVFLEANDMVSNGDCTISNG